MPLLAAAPVPPMAHHQLMIFLLQLGVLLLLAVLLGRLCVRIGLPAIVGELSVGIILGPSLLGGLAPGLTHWLLPARPDQTHLLDAVGQLAVLLLVGLAGMEMDLRMARLQRATVARVSLAGLLIPFALGVGVGFPVARLLGTGTSNTTVFVLFLGVAMCVSAIPVIAKTLLDMNLLHRNIGQLTLAAGVVDDVFGWTMLSLVSALAVGGLDAGNAFSAIGSIALVMVLAVVVGRPAVRLVSRWSKGSDAQSCAAATVLILLAAAGTHAAGLEAVLGAFVCGALMGADRGFQRRRIAPLQTVVLSCLAPIFFATAGLRIDLRALADPSILAAAVIVLSIAVLGKFAGAYLGARLSRLSKWEALALGAGMNARGVVEVIVAMVGLRLGILDTNTYTIIVLVAVATSVMAPPLLRVAMRRVEYTAEEELRLSARIQSAEPERVEAAKPAADAKSRQTPGGGS